WVQDFFHHHPPCVTNNASCPNRLIDVGQADGLRPPKFMETKTLRGNECRLYTTLSHCWGQNQTHLSEPCNLTKIPIWKLSKTYQDAIVITQKLGIRYIWIDSL
ncbi:HET-domain-containing protein, partial [Hyaloscypha bicolor E]